MLRGSGQHAASSGFAAVEWTVQRMGFLGLFQDNTSTACLAGGGGHSLIVMHTLLIPASPGGGGGLSPLPHHPLPPSVTLPAE